MACGGTFRALSSSEFKISDHESTAFNAGLGDTLVVRLCACAGDEPCRWRLKMDQFPQLRTRPPRHLDLLIDGRRNEAESAVLELARAARVTVMTSA